MVNDFKKLNEFYFLQQNIFFLMNFQDQTVKNNFLYNHPHSFPNFFIATKILYLFVLQKSNKIHVSPENYLKHFTEQKIFVKRRLLIKKKKMDSFKILKIRRRILKKYFFKKKLISYHFKKVKKLKFLKLKPEQEHSNYRRQFLPRHMPGFRKFMKKREYHNKKTTFKNDLKSLIKRKLRIFRLIQKKRAKRRVLKKRRYFTNTGILHYVVTKRNVKATVTNIKHDVLSYFSSGNKQFRKSKRRKLAAKKALTRKIFYFITQKKFKKLFIIIHGRLRTTRFLKRLYRKRKIRIIARIHNKLKPHNGCRKKKR